jgi:hypothetical protein
LFELSRLTASMAGIFGGITAAAALGSTGANLEQLLRNAGLDASALAGLTPSAALDLLAEHGIDPSAITAGQIEQYLAQMGLEEQVPGGLIGLWSGGSPKRRD